MGLFERAKWGAINGAQYVGFAALSASMMTMAILAGAAGKVAFTFAVARKYWAPSVLKMGAVKLDIRGLELVDWTRPCIIVANHQSLLDIPALQAALPVNLRFIAKEELLSVPFLGRYMKVAGMIGIDRTQPLAAIERIRDEARRSTADNAAIVVFGEGTRTRTGEIAGFKPGAILLAQQVGLPIVPLSIHGARDILPPDQMSARPGTIRIDIGSPIDTTDVPRRQLLQQVHEAVVALNVAAGGRGAAPSPRKARAAARAAASDVVSSDDTAANVDVADVVEVAVAG